MKYYFKVVVISFIGALSAVLVAQESQAISSDSLAQRIREVEQHLSPVVHIKGTEFWTLEERMKAYNVPGVSIAVINNYKVEWAKGYGVLSNTSQQKVNAHSLFQAASMSKPVNAMAILKYREIAGLDLEVDINELLTSWQFPYDVNASSQRINLKQLLSHTAGLSVHGFRGYKPEKSLPSIYEILEGKKAANSKAVKPLYTPGKAFKYSGGGTTISQLILTDLTQMPYEAFVDKNLFEPLKLKEAFYSVEREKYTDNMAFAHLKSGKQVKHKYQIYPESAAAGLWISPQNLAELLIDLQLSLTSGEGQLLSKSSAELLISPTIEGQNSALGVFTLLENGERYLQHSGANKGFRGKFIVGALNGKGVVIMTNGTELELTEEIVRSVSRVYEWPGFEQFETAANIKMDANSLKAFEGSYTKENRVLEVEIKKQKLILSDPGKWRSELTPLDETTFVIDVVKPRATIAFKKDEDGNVLSCTIVQDVVSEWQKVTKD